MSDAPADPRYEHLGDAQADPTHPDRDRFAAELADSGSIRTPAGDWPAPESVNACALIPVKNEATNIVPCLRRLLWCRQVVVVDSQSADETAPLAQAMGAEVYQFHYSKTGWPKKRNWALEHVPWRHEWVLILDADEHMTPELAREVEAVVAGRYKPERPEHGGCGDGYWLNRRFMFMGRWIRHSGYYPSWNVRLFKHRCGRYERIGSLGQTESGDNEVHEHVVLATGEPGRLRHDFLHYAYPDLSVWIEKHNRYTNWEAHALIEGNRGQIPATPFGSPIERRRWLKQLVRGLPCRPTLRFLYTYFFRLGFLDGYPGFILARLMAWYELISIAKHYELTHHLAGDEPAPPPAPGP